MREIKFRAWDKEEKTMCYDFLSDKWLEVAIKSPYVELMQYTGLKDCEGNEIYEGDLYETKEIIEMGVGGIILDKIESKIIEPIVFEKGSFYYDGDLLYDVIKYDENFKRVGNIYENKELLEDK